MKDYLRSHELAPKLGISQGGLNRLARKGIIPGHKVGNIWVFNEDEVEEYVRKPTCLRTLRGV